MGDESVRTHYCGRCLSTFQTAPEVCPNFACRTNRPKEGWGIIFEAGEVIDQRYRIRRRLATGGAGVTYLAVEVQPETEAEACDLAVKVLWATRDHGSYLRRLSQEAQILQELDHPHIVEYRGFVHRTGHAPYLVTRFELGGSLYDHVRRRQRLSLRESASIGRQTLEALGRAHQAGVIHRNLKPENLLLQSIPEPGQMPHILVADFGIAKVQGLFSDGLTRVGAFVGTPQHAAPEQFYGLPPSPATDVFATGAMLYFCLQGQPLLPLAYRLSPEDARELLIQKLPPKLVLPDEKPEQVRAIEQVLAACMAEDPDQRPTATEALARLEACMAEDPDQRPTATEALARVEELLKDRRQPHRLDSPDLDSRITDSTCRYWLPYPIAALYRLRYSDHEPTPRLYYSLRLAEGIVRFLALANLADALSRQPSAEKREQWLGYLKAASIGSLAPLLSSTTKYLSNHGEAFLPFLAELRADKAWHETLDRIRTMRNTVFHRSFHPKRGQAQAMLDQLEPDLARVLRAASQLRSYQLGVVHGSSGETGRHIYHWYASIGPEESCDPIRLAGAIQPPTGSPMLLNPISASALLLHPWLRLCPVLPLGHEELVMWLDHLDGTSKAVFIHPLRETFEYVLDDFPAELDHDALTGVINLVLDQASRAAIQSPPHKTGDFDGYRLVGCIGRGGMGEVWEAEDILGRKVALKLLSKELVRSLTAARRFEREGRTLVRLQRQAGIVDVYAAGRSLEDVPYLAMQFVEGEDLQRRLDRTGALPLEEAVSIMTRVLELLEVAHDHGVFHRDVKPSNFMLSGSEVTMIDFGIAAFEDGTRYTRTANKMGTPGYRAPEVEEQPKAPATRQMDVYGAGALFFSLFAHKRPNLLTVLRLNKELPDTPAPIRDVIRRAMAHESEDRFPSALAMREALEAAASGEA